MPVLGCESVIQIDIQLALVKAVSGVSKDPELLLRVDIPTKAVKLLLGTPPPASQAALCRIKPCTPSKPTFPGAVF